MGQKKGSKLRVPSLDPPASGEHEIIVTDPDDADYCEYSADDLDEQCKRAMERDDIRTSRE